jgi:hypothetical protein
LNEIQMGKLNDVITDQKKTIRREKTYKWLSIIGGGALATFLSYSYFMK